jgi:hypothetical protein
VARFIMAVATGGTMVISFVLGWYYCSLLNWCKKIICQLDQIFPTGVPWTVAFGGSITPVPTQVSLFILC